jgi:hypothetical protein
MEKLTLKLDELTVESFRTDDDPEEPRGTVHGHYGTNHTQDFSCQTGCRLTCVLPCD